ncbi:MAG: hypothetical protein FVQ80_07340 [Planctomycetes bacterium]|nr:hypothetical protein [Planctomycetota bacterium]
MGWKAKFIFILFVYFAGFSTATYVVGPKPKADPFKASTNKAFNFEAIVHEFNGKDEKSKKLAQSFNTGLHKSFGFSKDAAIKMTDFIKQQIEQRKKGQTGFK